MSIFCRKLSNGVLIPSIGLGTYPMTGEILTKSVYNAYLLGYRLIDTADNYYNGKDLGISLEFLYNSTDAKRQDLFIVSKISDELYKPGTLGGGTNKGIFFWKNSPIMQGEGAVRRVIRQKVHNSLKFIKSDYLDLLLMHWPYPDFFEEIWYEMENIYKDGLVRSIGVCNCRERHLQRLKNSHIFPMVNQFESSPINTKESLIGYCRSNNVQVMTYSPLMSLKLGRGSEYYDYLETLALKYGKTVSQIVLRYNIEMGLIPIPKSSKRERLELNIDIFNFKLENVELTKLIGFNENKQYLPESKSCPGL